jgi:hypothetical protein
VVCRDRAAVSAALSLSISNGQVEGYEQSLNEATVPIYEFTHQLASLEPPSLEMQQLFAALRGNQEQTNGFFGMLAGTVPIPKFFAPENLGQIMGAAAAATVDA